MNVFIFELRSKQKSIIIWTLCNAMTLLLFMSFFPSFRENTGLIYGILYNYPEALLKIFALNKAIPLNSLIGFFCFSFLFIQLCLGIQSSIYGFSMTTYESKHKLSDFIFSKPASRIGLYTAKLSANLVSLLLTQLALWITTLFILNHFKGSQTLSYAILTIVFLGTLLFQLTMFFLSNIIASFIKKINNVHASALGLSFSLYTLHALNSIIGSNRLGQISPFYYYDVNALAVHRSISIQSLTFTVVVILLGFCFPLFHYLKRDLPNA